MKLLMKRKRKRFLSHNSSFFSYIQIGGKTMDNHLHFEQTPYHHVCLKDRKSIELTGVKKIESFDSYEFLIETSLGFLNITGTELTLVRLDQDQNEVSIRGNIDSMSYITDKKKSHQKEKGLSKLLK